MAKCTASQVLTIARSQIGVKESPANSNKVKYTEWRIGKKSTAAYKYYHWCMIFVDWCLNQCGWDVLNNKHMNDMSCTAVMNWAKKAGYWIPVAKGGKPGDIAIFDWERDGKANHTGFVEKKLSDGIYQTIEGNTGIGNDSNGGEVMRRKRERKYILGFVRLPYAAPAKTAVKRPKTFTVPTPVLNKHDTTYKQTLYLQKFINFCTFVGLKTTRLAEDGSWGPKTDKAFRDCEKWAKAKGFYTGEVERIKYLSYGPKMYKAAKAIKKKYS